MTDQLREQAAVMTPTQVVEKFLYALQDKDFDALPDLIDDDVVYQNVGFSEVQGRRRVLKILGGLRRPNVRFEVKNHRIAADGSSVLTERTDALVVGRFRAQFWACGTSEVHDGRITLWRDYFDVFDVTKAIVRGLLGIAVPSLRQSL